VYNLKAKIIVESPARVHIIPKRTPPMELSATLEFESSAIARVRRCVRVSCCGENESLRNNGRRCLGRVTG
jgi:hypothetical protein